MTVDGADMLGELGVASGVNVGDALGVGRTMRMAEDIPVAVGHLNVKAESLQ